MLAVMFVTIAYLLDGLPWCFTAGLQTQRTKPGNEHAVTAIKPEGNFALRHAQKHMLFETRQCWCVSQCHMPTVAFRPGKARAGALLANSIKQSLSSGLPGGNPSLFGIGLRFWSKNSVVKSLDERANFAFQQLRGPRPTR